MKIYISFYNSLKLNLLGRFFCFCLILSSLVSCHKGTIPSQSPSSHLLVSDSLILSNDSATKSEYGFSLSDKNENRIPESSFPDSIAGDNIDVRNAVANKNYIYVVKGDRLLIYNRNTNSHQTIVFKFPLLEPKRSLDDDTLIWINSFEGISILNKNNLKLYRIQIKGLQNLNEMRLDSKYLYAERDSHLVIFNKHFLLQHLLDNDQFAFEIDQFQTYINEEISTFRGDFRSTVSKFRETEFKYGSSTNPLIEYKLKELKASVINSLPYSFDENKQFERFARDSVNDPEITARYYFHAIKLAGYEGKLKEVCYYDSILKQNYPQFRNSTHVNAMLKVKEADSALNQLAIKELKEDERLWETGLLYSDLFNYIGPVYKGRIQKAYPFAYFRELLKKYPESQFADDADFMIMTSYQPALEEIDSHDKWISNYQRFLGAYPATNRRPEIYARLINLYYTQAEFDKIMSKENKEELLLNSLGYANKLLNEFPEYSQDHDSDKLKNLIIKAISKLKWSFQIRSDKKIYQPGETVYITFDLKNTDTYGKKVSVFEDPQQSNFILAVRYFPLEINEGTFDGKPSEFDNDLMTSHRQGLFVTEGSELDAGYMDSLIGPNEQFIERWNILTSIRQSFAHPMGHYILAKEGKYRITGRAFSDDLSQDAIDSNVIWITVRGKE